MSTWTAKAHQLREAQANILCQILREADPDDPQFRERVYRTTAAGDERKLRGIPCIARGVGGAIPGSSPHAIR